MNTINKELFKKVRDPGIDVLRMLAITGIVIVHINPSIFWQQIRSYDVPLMVILSGICFGLPTTIKKSDYYRKRFIRMIIPSWLFLSMYFSVNFLMGNDVEFKRVLMCYTFMTPWYFWIVRILFVTAVAAPFLAAISRRLSTSNIVVLIVVLLFISEILAQISDNYLYVVVVMFVPYLAYFMLGMNLERFSASKIAVGGLFMLLCYFSIATYLFLDTNEYIPTGSQKYPPPNFIIVHMHLA